MPARHSGSSSIFSHPQILLLIVGATGKSSSSIFSHPLQLLILGATGTRHCWFHMTGEGADLRSPAQTRRGERGAEKSLTALERRNYFGQSTTKDLLRRPLWSLCQM